MSEQVVAGEPVEPLEPPDAAAERGPGDTDLRHLRAGRREPVRGGRGVDLAPSGASAGIRRSRGLARGAERRGDRHDGLVVGRMTSPLMQFHVHHMEGAFARVPEAATAVSHAPRRT
jgi:hypothetical protein